MEWAFSPLLAKLMALDATNRSRAQTRTRLAVTQMSLLRRKLTLGVSSVPMTPRAFVNNRKEPANKGLFFSKRHLRRKRISYIRTIIDFRDGTRK